jgi:hypothetical protein
MNVPERVSYIGEETPFAPHYSRKNSHKEAQKRASHKKAQKAQK